MIATIISLLTGNKLVRMIGAAVLAVLGVLSFGAVKKREGRKEEKAAAEIKTMKEDLKAHERINQADLGIGATDAERVDRLRGFAAKHGNRPPKGPSGGLR